MTAKVAFEGSYSASDRFESDAAKFKKNFIRSNMQDLDLNQIKS